MTNEQTAKAKDEEAQEPEYTLEMSDCGECRVKRSDWYVTGWLTAQTAANIANARNSFGAMKELCEAVIDCSKMRPVELAEKALHLATLYDDEGRLKDE